MPLYEYICKKCGHKFEEVQKFSDPPLTKCPQCKGKVEKQMSAAGFQLKGSGWYKDGYSKTSEKASTAPSASTPGSSPTPTQAASTGESTKATPAKSSDKKSSGPAKEE